MGKVGKKQAEAIAKVEEDKLHATVRRGESREGNRVGEFR